MHMNKEVVMVRLSDIIPNRFQPRLTFDEEALNELANSIKEHGIIQPLILRDLGSKYEIIAGERRYKAATLAGLTEVPAIIGSMDDQTSAELALIENIQRKDLSAIEEAKSYKKILDMGNLTQEVLAQRMGKSQSTIANKMRLLTLTNEVQVALMNNLISERHARCLLQIKDEDLQKEVLNKIISERMNVRDTDEYIKNLLGLPHTEVPEKAESINTPAEGIISTEEAPKVEAPNTINSTPKIDIPVPPSNEKVKENPNVYTQTKNLDFVNIGTLNDEEPLLKSKDSSIITALPDEKINEEKLGDSIMPNFEIPNIDVQNLEQTINNTNSMDKVKLSTAIRLAKDTVEDIKTAGYQVTMEELDTEKEYQIIIKVKK
ncbi:MAG: ParB/RepB/Spo0J family partition protein [Bacilli bacterium]